MVIVTILPIQSFEKGQLDLDRSKVNFLQLLFPVSAVSFAFAIMNEHFFAIDFIEWL